MADDLYQKALKHNNYNEFPLYVLYLVKAQENGLYLEDSDIELDSDLVYKYFSIIIDLLEKEIPKDVNGYVFTMLGDIRSIDYFNGLSINLENRYKKVIGCYSAAIYKGNIEALYKKGSFLVRMGKGEEGIKCYEEAISKGCVKAMYDLAKKYEKIKKFEGRMPSNEYKERRELAIKYYKMAADHGHPPSMLYLYEMYSRGEYQDKQKAIYYYKMYLSTNITNNSYVKLYMDDILQVLEEYIVENGELKKENKGLKLEVLDLKYRPGGKGAIEAKEHFKSLLE